MGERFAFLFHGDDVPRAKIRVTKSSQLGRINAVIHDYWFDLDDVTFNEAKSTLQIRFVRPWPEAEAESPRWSLFRRVNVPYVESFLRVHHVRSWILEDTQRIGSYDFNELRFDEAKKRIRVSTGVPLGLYADIERLEVSVVVTDNIVESKKRLRFLV